MLYAWRDLCRNMRGSTQLTSVAPLEAGKAPLQTVAGSGRFAAESIVQTILTSLDDSKAEEVVPIDLHGKTSLADVMVVATGRSNVHVGAIAERVIRSCKDAGVNPRVEGMPNNDWVLVDAGDVIVHIFRPEVRQFYNLEKMWGGDRPGESRSSETRLG